jgi:hypothetical protein
MMTVRMTGGAAGDCHLSVDGGCMAESAQEKQCGLWTAQKPKKSRWIGNSKVPTYLPMHSKSRECKRCRSVFYFTTASNFF